MTTFASRLQQLRAEHNWSQLRCARQLGVKRSSVANWEVGRAEPNIKMLHMIADTFQVSVDYLIGRSDIRHATADAPSQTSLDAILYDRDIWLDAHPLTTEDKHIILAVIRAVRSIRTSYSSPPL